MDKWRRWYARGSGIGGAIVRVDNVILDYISPNAKKTTITKLVPFGDSMTDAEWKDIAPLSYYKVPNPRDHWTKILERELVVPMSNHGIAGDTAVNIATGNNTRIADMIAEKPSHVMLMIGGNDIYGGATPDQIMTNIDIIVKRLQEVWITVILMWCNIGTFSGAPTDVALQKTRIADMPNKYQSYATANNLKFINFLNTPLYNGDVVPIYYLPDKIHVNTMGHPIMATYIMKQLGVL